MSSPSPKPKPEEFDLEVVEEANRAWLAAFFTSPIAHRSNAQAGYTVAAAVAAAVVGAGILTSVGTAPWGLQISALVTLGLWLLAAWAFMRAVAIQPDLGGVVHERGPGLLAEQAIQRTWKERAVIADRSRVAQRIALLAGVATFVTIGATMFSSTGSGGDTAVAVALTPGGRAHYAELCGERARIVEGRLDPDDLSERFVPLTDAGCAGETSATLRLRADDIAGLVGP